MIESIVNRYFSEDDGLECDISSKLKYSIMLPTRGFGSTFEIFLTYLLPRYVKFLDISSIEDFIVVCPQESIEDASARILERGGKIPFTFYTDESLFDSKVDGWLKQQVIKLAICSKIRTKYYFVIDDDLIITKNLMYNDLFDENNRIYYSSESWPYGGRLNATEEEWWIRSSLLLKFDYNVLKSEKNLMGVTPQMLITSVVRDLIMELGDKWMNRMAKFRATEYSLYWIYLIKTSRANLYTPSHEIFEMDEDVNILVDGLNKEQIYLKIEKGIQGRKYWFIVAQSIFNYPKEWIEKALKADI